MTSESHAEARPDNRVARVLPRWRTLSTDTLLNVLAVCTGYYAAGLLSLVARFPESGISTIWLATPVLLAAFLVAPPRTWWL